MNFISIKGLETKVSQLIMGSDYFMPEKIEQVSDILDAYVQIGGNTIDTAHIYCGGKSELALGLWLQNRGKRDDIVIFTKGAHHDAKGPRVNAEAIEHDLMTSLERLQTDYVDLYGLHRDDPNVPVGPIIEALNRHIEAGRIRAIGASNWTHGRIQEANDYAAAHGLQGFSFSSPNLSLAKANEPYWEGCVTADAETCAWHASSQLPLLSWSSQARGFFTGRYRPEDRSDADTVRVFYSDANWERLRRAEELARKRGVTAIQIALAYVLNQPFPTAALIGPRNQAEMESCAEATRIQLTPEEMDWLEKVEA
ncbi:aldo/keto reductase [Paenibacillus sp. J2TS4]|uniref:aldo/keto reductase n=1 Tax=Paenibacillus sp. J2TS4 TaxID=2807194 RepID=UPI001B0FC53A|nr:aldo/keto reductase [Paenibacillus sp. J2TS4]GIP34796.1 oxidoreductase [Paenibacillus sp. J2TS4]